MPRETVRTSQEDVSLPILYFETRFFLAMFRTSPELAAKTLGDLGLNVRPAVFFGSNTIAGLALFEYVHTSIGPYNEVGLFLATVPARSRPPAFPLLQTYVRPEKRTVGFAVLDLPVTSAAANVAGREIWGYPKFVTELPLHFSQREFAGAVLDPEKKEICSLSGRIKPALRLPAFDLVTHTSLNGALVKTSVNVRGSIRVFRNTEFRLAVGNSSHRMATHLRDLGLEGARPFALAVGVDWQSRLNRGEVIG